MTQWFLQRGDRYYGPFSTAKVEELLNTGRINQKTLVATSKEGVGPRALGTIPELGSLLALPEKPVAKSAPQESDNHEWFIVDDEDQKRGPYQMAHLQKLLAAGKLKPETRVQKKDSEQNISLNVLVPATPAPEPRAEPRQPGRKRPKAVAPPVLPKKGKMLLVLGGLVVVVVIAAIGLSLFPMDKGKGLSFMKNLKSSVQEEPALVSASADRARVTPPPYGQIVEKALRTGLNFQAGEVLKYNQDDLLIFDRSQALEYNQIYPQTRREIRFSTNGGLSYTYLLDGSGWVFAVLVAGGSLDNFKLSNASLQDFSTTALPPLDLPDQTIWRAQITKELMARVVWTRRKNNEKYLEYILVTSNEIGNSR